MLIINGKAMLKIGNRYINPGEEVEIPDGLAEKLKSVGLVETATVEMPEKAVMKAEVKPDVPKPNNTTKPRTPKPRAGKKPFAAGS